MKDKELKSLIKKAQRHNADAFTELMQLCMKDMYRTAIAILMNEEDAADAIQDTILSCWEKFSTLREPKYFKTWMIRILINHCYDIIGARKNFTNIEEYEEVVVCDEYNLELKEAYASLDKKYRLPMTLFYGQGYKVKEIAELLHVPQSTVKTWLSRGRTQLEKYYKER